MATDILLAHERPTTPVRLIRESAAAHGISYLIDQVYLQMPAVINER